MAEAPKKGDGGTGDGPPGSFLLHLTLLFVSVLVLSGMPVRWLRGEENWLSDVPVLVWAILAAIVVIAFLTGQIRTAVMTAVKSVVKLTIATATAFVIGVAAYWVTNFTGAPQRPLIVGAMLAGFLAVLLSDKLGFLAAGGGGHEDAASGDEGGGDEHGDDDDD